MSCSACVYTEDDCPDCGECICSCFCDYEDENPYGDDYASYNLRPAETGGTVVYGPHCSHEDCGFGECGETGRAEFPCGKPGCPYCRHPGSDSAVLAQLATLGGDDGPA